MTAGELVDVDLSRGAGWELRIPVAGRRPIFGRLLAVRAWDGLVQIDLEQSGFRTRASTHLLAPFDMVELYEEDPW